MSRNRTLHPMKTLIVCAAALALVVPASAELARVEQGPAVISFDAQAVAHGWELRVTGPGGFSYPTIKGHRLDWCKHWGRECGKPAADLFCLESGYAGASQWAFDPDVSGAPAAQPPTLLVRALPLNQAGAVVGQPSNIIRVIFGPEPTPDLVGEDDHTGAQVTGSRRLAEVL